MIGWSREEILRRNEQLARYRRSREDIVVSNNRQWREELKELVRHITEDRLSKPAKKLVLKRLRELEALLRIDLGDYNSSDFASEYYEKST